MGNRISRNKLKKTTPVDDKNTRIPNNVNEKALIQYLDNRFEELTNEIDNKQYDIEKRSTKIIPRR
jgi:hypothetical protein